MDTLILQTLLNKLRQVHQIGSMSAAAAGLSRMAAGGCGTAPAAAASAATLHRGLRTVAAAGTSGGAASTLAGQQQQQQQQQPQQQRGLSTQPVAAAHRRLARNLPVATAMHGAAAAAAAATVTSYRTLGGLHGRPGEQQRRHASAAAAQLAASEDGEEGVVAPGSLLEFERAKGYLLGRAVKPTPQGWQVEAASGTLYSVKAGDIKYVLPGGAARSAADLAAVAAAADGEAAGRGAGLLVTAWEMSADDAGAGPIFTVPDMADLLFGAADASACAAALRLLRDDRLYFKQVGRSPPLFSARTAAQVSSLEGALRQQQQAEQEWGRFAAAIEQARQAPRASKPSEAAWRAGPYGERLAAVEALALAALPALGPLRSLATSTLIQLGRPPAGQDAAELLQSVGWWPPHLQFNLLAAGISDGFDPALEAEAAALLASPPPDLDAARRRDFTAAHSVITIDDASTTEIDDGLSLERLPNGQLKVWVHIADPSRWVAPGSALAAEARSRATSLYLPTGMVPMFPKCLAEGPFSLRAGVPTCAVSVGACLGGDGGLLADSVEVVPSRVAPARRLTYDDVDEMLAVCEQGDERDLFDLLAVAERRRLHRLARGAVEIQMPKSSVSVEGAEREAPAVTVEPEDAYGSPSRQLVSELMILAGEAVAELGRRLGVPLPYRGQAEPVLPEPHELAAVPPGPCRAVLLRMRMTRSVTVTREPLRHAGLGLDGYVQFTSPIRRFSDLLAHWQLKAVLRGEPAPVAADPLLATVEELGATTQRLAKLERETEAYWVAEYFRQATATNPRAAWEATFLCWVKQEAGLGRMLVDELGLETVVRINSPLQPGQRVHMRCLHTDPRQGMYRLEVVSGY